jgi:hypothetical protein
MTFPMTIRHSEHWPLIDPVVPVMILRHLTTISRRRIA